MARKNFAVMSVAAQEDNLGDVEIRKKLFDRIRTQDIDIVAFCGTSSPEYMEAFGDALRCSWFTSMIKMQLEVLRRCLVGQSMHFFIAPGPARFSSKPRALAKSLVNFMNMALARLTGGAAHIVGRAYRGSGTSRAIEVLSAKLATTATVRDDMSFTAIGGRARVMPDLAFASDLTFDGPRNYLAISLRVEPDLSAAHVESIVKASRAAGLEPVFVTQVRRDNEWMLELARQHGAEIVAWTTETHRLQRERVGLAYRKAAAVVSNRLHGLIIGALAGATPVPVVSSMNTKLVPTLRVVFPEIQVISECALNDKSGYKLKAALETAASSRAQMREPLAVAREVLEQHLDRVVQRMSPKKPELQDW